ncbi:MAG: hypothetical protein QOG54_1615 [Actinomycetota bacterium]|jgi:hypothetical protein|nr:hypothetical protein [Actinomycetota bacterium]
MISAQACSEFTVGSEQWTDCIHNASTAGGVMPWAVLVPMGVMLVGMAYMFWRQFSGRQAAAFSSATTPSYVGQWLIFIGVVELLMGAGFIFGYSRGGGAGALIPAVILSLVGVVLLLIGLASRGKARNAARIQSTGVQGSATILSVTQTGMFMNQNPQIALDLEVQVPGIPTYRHTQKMFVPLILLSRVTPGATVPVMVDPQSQADLVIIW